MCTVLPACLSSSRVTAPVLTSYGCSSAAACNVILTNVRAVDYSRSPKPRPESNAGANAFAASLQNITKSRRGYGRERHRYGRKIHSPSVHNRRRPRRCQRRFSEWRAHQHCVRSIGVRDDTAWWLLNLTWGIEAALVANQAAQTRRGPDERRATGSP